jgi:hypothetical protein
MFKINFKEISSCVRIKPANSGFKSDVKWTDETEANMAGFKMHNKPKYAR